MYLLLESLRSAFASIRAHGFRSFLTALGIIIGVASVVAVVSIVQGLSYTVNAQFQGLGSNSITVRSFTPFQQQMQGRLAKLTEDDLRVIEHRVDGISHITPMILHHSLPIRMNSPTPVPGNSRFSTTSAPTRHTRRRRSLSLGVKNRPCWGNIWLTSM